MKPLPDYNEYFEEKGKDFAGFEQIESSDYRNFIEDLYESNSEDDEEDEEAAKAREAKRLEEERKKKEAEEELKPTEWACDICTLVNPISIGTCDICQ